MKLKTFLRIFGGVAVLLTLLPFIAIDYWWIRVFDFPHFQLTTLTLIALLAYFIRFNIKSTKDYIFVIALTACFAYQFSIIYPYTALAPYEILEHTEDDTKKSLSVFTANVLQKNEKHDKLLQEIKKQNADVLLFTETDMKWKNKIAPNLASDYKYKVEIPLDNTYGMLLYSKLPLINPQKKFIVDDSIPSIHSKVLLHSGDTIQLFAIHPTPPMPQHNPSSTDRDAEMMKIALASRASEYPVIVVGDFNDVAWSASTTLFQEISGLLDVRNGRGFFNTYHAQYIILRWPLDHIFASEHFRVNAVKRGEDIGSDHFPLYVDFSFEPTNGDVQKLPPPSDSQLEKAYAQIKNEEKHDEG